MKRTSLFLVPLMVAVAFTLLVTPVAAGIGYVDSSGTGFAKVKRSARSMLGWYEYGETRFIYCMSSGWAWLQILPMGADALYLIDYGTVRESDCYQTFRAAWIPLVDWETYDDYIEPDGKDDIDLVDSELCTSAVRVIVFVTGDDPFIRDACVIVYGWGVAYTGTGYACYE